MARVKSESNRINRLEKIARDKHLKQISVHALGPVAEMVGNDKPRKRSSCLRSALLSIFHTDLFQKEKTRRLTSDILRGG